MTAHPQRDRKWGIISSTKFWPGPCNNVQLLNGLMRNQAAHRYRVGSMMAGLAQKQNSPAQATTAHAKGIDSPTAARDARHPNLHPSLRGASRNAPAPPPLAHSGGSHDGPLSREAPRLTYDVPISAVGRSSQPVLQAKLAISAPSDDTEKEADRLADQVIRMPDSQGSGAHARREARPEFLARQARTEGVPVQMKAAAQRSAREAAVPPAVSEVLRSSGQPLDRSTRAFMEPRFGHDFSSVRVHKDSRASRSAQAINAQAYTVGNDVVFNHGHYAPETNTGRHLLAHELSHVLQQKSSPIIQRKSVAGDALEGMLALLILYASDDVESEILKGILASQRPLNLQGTDKQQEAQLRAHVDARKGIVDFAEKNTFAYAAKDYKYNSDFWDDSTDGPEKPTKPGVSLRDADADLHVHPEEYALGCKQAAVITVRAGSNYSQIVKDENVSDHDWIPGDWGYIENPKVKSGHPGQEGQNLIYLGRGQFWGAIDGKTTRTMKEWLAQVYSWDGVANLLSWRKRPILGVSKTKP